MFIETMFNFSVNIILCAALLSSGALSALPVPRPPCWCLRDQRGLRVAIVLLDTPPLKLNSHSDAAPASYQVPALTAESVPTHLLAPPLSFVVLLDD